MRTAIWERAGPLPEEEVERLECLEHGCRPSELDEEDEWTLQAYRLLREYRWKLEHPR